MSRKRGFTLLELLIVVAIIAVLIALALPFYQDYITKSKYTAALADLSNIRKAVQMYEQVEQSSLTVFDLRPLIGDYLEDFRKSDLTQTTPRDPYGNDYSFNPERGLLISYGPNHMCEMTTADLKARRATGDDICVTYLPPFYLMRVSTLNNRELELEFSRRVNDSLISSGMFGFYVLDTTTGQPKNPATGANFSGNAEIYRISSTVYRLRFQDADKLQSGAYYRAYANGVKSQGGRNLTSDPGTVGNCDADDRPGSETKTSMNTNNGAWLDFSAPAS
ncbi:MAG: prepilin-type N-terminal cleavage/methylation domain-containing protein [Candidatus Riflebacteria bacterium]|nr:prepilin-type N-terminal cleavage/methylation domain-containing protein [Candidatus Riflebacteria bacterium]